MEAMSGLEELIYYALSWTMEASKILNIKHIKYFQSKDLRTTINPAYYVMNKTLYDDLSSPHVHYIILPKFQAFIGTLFLILSLLQPSLWLILCKRWKGSGPEICVNILLEFGNGQNFQLLVWDRSASDQISSGIS